MRWWVLVIVLGGAAIGRAEAPPARTARLLAIKAAVRDEAHRCAVWRWSWVAAYGAVTLGQLAPLPFLKDQDLVIDFAVGAVSSALGGLVLMVLPLKIATNSDKVLAQPDTDEGLSRAEALAQLDAADQLQNVSWVAHVGNVVINLAVGLVLGLGWRHWDSAAISFGVGTALGEVTLLTQSTALGSKLRLAPVVLPAGGGLQLALAW